MSAEIAISGGRTLGDGASVTRQYAIEVIRPLDEEQPPAEQPSTDPLSSTPPTAARTLAAGRSASLRVRLTTAAAKRLRGRRVTVPVKIGVAAGDAKVNRVVRATIRGRR